MSLLVSPDSYISLLAILCFIMNVESKIDGLTVGWEEKMGEKKDIDKWGWKIAQGGG